MAFRKIVNGSALPKGVETADNVNSTIESTVETSVAALVGSAPAVLDTLEELSTALGNDENFATTVTTALSGKSNTGHGHAISDVTNLQNSLDNKASVSHFHDINNITGLSMSLMNKAPYFHSHSISDVTNLQTSLDGKASTQYVNDEISGISSLTDNTILKSALFFGGN